MQRKVYKKPTDEKMQKVSWANIKNRKNLYRNYLIEDNKYFVYAHEDKLVYYATIDITTPKNADQIDFEDNYKNLWCELSLEIRGVDASNGDSVLQGANADSIDDNDHYYVYDPTESVFLHGGYLYCENVNIGDTVTFQIVLDVGGGNYYVITEYMKNLKLFDKREIKLMLQTHQMKWIDYDNHSNLRLRLKVNTQRTDFKILLEYYFYKY